MIIEVKYAQRGDADAFVRLMEENKKSMERIACSFFLNEADVADVLQETVLNAYEHISELKNPKFFKTWLVRILINNCTSIYNRRKNETQMDVIPDSWMVSEWPSDVNFKEMIAELPDDSRLIFQLYYGERLTSREIGEILDISENTIKSKLHRGKQQLRTEMKIEVDLKQCERL